MAVLNLGSTDWLLQIVLMVMLAATMFHAFRLERALGVLRRDRAALEELVSGFNESTRQAENGIERLRAAADGAGRQIARQVDQARNLKNDLEFLISRGEKVADHLEKVVRIKPALEAAGPGPSLPAPLPTAALVAPFQAGPEEQDTRLRSQAEKDLLRALRAAR